jgi:hypothetical protein
VCHGRLPRVSAACRSSRQSRRRTSQGSTTARRTSAGQGCLCAGRCAPCADAPRRERAGERHSPRCPRIAAATQELPQFGTKLNNCQFVLTEEHRTRNEENRSNTLADACG